MTGSAVAITDITLDDILAELRAGIAGATERVLVGLNWTLVVGPSGAGCAHTPARGTAGCRSLPEPGTYAGRPLAELATLVASDNVFEQTIGFAAINAHHNRYDLEGAPENGLDLVEPRGERTVVIGRFPGLDERLPGAAVIEREPGPGDYPEEAADELLPKAEQLVITASTLTNLTLPQLLSLAPKAFTVVLGPSTPLCRGLFRFGIDALSGLVITDLAGAASVVTEGGAVSALKRHARFVTITR